MGVGRIPSPFSEKNTPRLDKLRVRQSKIRYFFERNTMYIQSGTRALSGGVGGRLVHAPVVGNLLGLLRLRLIVGH